MHLLPTGRKTLHTPSEERAPISNLLYNPPQFYYDCDKRAQLILVILNIWVNKLWEKPFFSYPHGFLYIFPIWLGQKFIYLLFVRIFVGYALTSLSIRETTSQYEMFACLLNTVCCCSVSRVCDPTDCSTPGLPALHHLLALAQTHVHWGSEAVQPPHSRRPLLLLPSTFPSIRLFSNEFNCIFKYN